MAVGRSLPSLGRYRGLFAPRQAPTTRAYCTLFGFTGGVVLLTAGSVFCSVIARHPQSGGHPMHTPPLPLALATIVAGVVMVAASLLAVWRYGMDDGDDALEDETQFVVCNDALDHLYQQQQQQQQLQQQQMLYHRLIETQLQRERASLEAANLQQQQNCSCYNSGIGGALGTTMNHTQQSNGCSCGASGSNTKDYIRDNVPETGCTNVRRPDTSFVVCGASCADHPLCGPPTSSSIARSNQAPRIPVLTDNSLLHSSEGGLSKGLPRGTPMAVTASGTLVPSRLPPSSSSEDCRTSSTQPQKMASIIVADKDAIKVILDNS